MLLSNLLLLLVCVAPLANTLLHPISSNIAVYSTVSVTCDQSPCTDQQRDSSKIIDNDNGTVWRSIGSVTSQYQITLNFKQEYEVSEICVTFPSSSPLPSQWSIEVSLDNITYKLVEYFATECVSNSEDDCTQINSIFGPFTARISTEYLQDKRLQFLRINFNSFQSNLKDIPLYYSLSEVEVNGDCSCNGYDRGCHFPVDSTELYECACRENTCGIHCDYCCEGYELIEYVSRRNDPSSTCKKCDNCTTSLLQEFDTLLNTLNSTTERVDLITLTISSQLENIAEFISKFSVLYESTRTYLLETSSIEFAVYRTATSYSIETEVPVLQCVTLSELSIPQRQDELNIQFQIAYLTLFELTESNQEFSDTLNNQDQLVDILYQNLTQYNLTLLEYLNILTESLLELRKFGNELKQNTLEAKSQLSIILSNHIFINTTLYNAISTRTRAIQWQNTIDTLLTNIQQLYPRVTSLELELIALSNSLEVLRTYTNNSQSLFVDIEGYRVILLSLLSGNMELTGNISSVSSDLESLNSSISSLLAEITELIINSENCLDSIRTSTEVLTNKNGELEVLNTGTETELKLFLNTGTVESADAYILQAEIYARELASSFELLYNLARYTPNTSVSLSLTEVQVLTAISGANGVVTERERLNYIINQILSDNIFSQIGLFKQLIASLNESAVNLSIETTEVLNSINPFIDRTNELQNLLGELRRRVGILLVNSRVQYREDEYTSVLPILRSDLENNRSLLLELEPNINRTLLEVLAAQDLLPNITEMNNQTRQLRRTRLYEIRDLKESTFYISTELNTLHSNASIIKTRNYNILSRLQKVYSRLSRVHNELQLPKAPLRLDGSMVVSLQPPPTEQLENATYSTDFSFYFEPVKNALTDIPQSTFLFFYAGPAILSNSTNISVLGTEDYISIVSTLGVMGYRARIGGREFSEDLRNDQTIRSNSKYIVRIKRVGSAFRFELNTPTNKYQIATTLSEETLHKFAFKPTQNTVYYIGGHPDDVLIADSLQSLDKFRGCVYLALTLRWNLYSLWDTRYHTNLLTDQTGLDCIRHGETQADFDVDGLSFNGYGHAYIRNTLTSPIIRFSVTPQEHNGLILTAFGRNSANKDYIFSFYLRDRKFNFDISYNGEGRTTSTLDNLSIKVSTRYDITLSLSSSGVTATVEYEEEPAVVLETEVDKNLFNSEVLLFGGISPLAVDQSSSLEGWATDYYKNFTGCIANIVVLRTTISDTLIDSSFNFNSGGTTGVSLGCPNFPIPEYSVTKTDTTGYLKFGLLVHEGVSGSFTQFYHGVGNYELLPGAVGTLANNPVDLRSPYSIGIIASKPKFIGEKAVLIHISDYDVAIALEVSIDRSLNVSLNVTRGGVTEIILSPLDTSRKRPMHAITVHSIGAGGLELYVDDNSPVTLAGEVNLVLPVELSENQNVFVGGNKNPEYSYVGCIKEVALYDSLLNLGLGIFVPTGSSPAGSEGILHDMCGFHPYNGLIYGGARALTSPFDFAEAVRNA